MANNIATIKDKKLNTLIRQTVIEVIQDIFADPDYGLSLRPEFEKRLKKSIASKKAGRVISFDEIKRKYHQK